MGVTIRFQLPHVTWLAHETVRMFGVCSPRVCGGAISKRFDQDTNATPQQNRDTIAGLAQCAINQHSASVSELRI
jgi:hypothetical protein